MDEKQLPLLAHQFFNSEKEGKSPECTEENDLDPNQVVKRMNSANSYTNGSQDDVCVPITKDVLRSFSRNGDDTYSFPKHGIGNGNEGGDIHRMQKAINLFSNLPSLGKASPINPFMSRTPTIDGLYEYAKTVMLLPVLILRVMFIGVILLVGYLATKTALAGWEKGQALSRWRNRLMVVTRLCARGLLYCFGFHWIRRIGRPASKEVAPIVVSNHVSFIDPIFYFYELFPTIVSAKSHDSIPLAGTIIRSMQVIPVDRTSSESRKYATLEIKKRAASTEFPSVLLFPEGTTTNGRALISFKLGAFVPGFPIQPVVIRYPFVHFDISWGDTSLSNVMLRMFTQINNFMEVEYLPVMYPSARERENPSEFAERVKFEMAQALCVPETEHTYMDLTLSLDAQRLCSSSPGTFMVEMGKIEKVLRLNAVDMDEFLEKYTAMKPTNCGTVSMDSFLEWHNLPRCWISEKIFNLYDKSEQGFMTFREFVAVSGSISKNKEFESQMRSAYDACYSQRDGCISLEALERSLRLSMSSISVAKVQTWFKKLDQNGDGVISWEEFEVFIKANPEILPIFMVGTFAPCPHP